MCCVLWEPENPLRELLSDSRCIFVVEQRWRSWIVLSNPDVDSEKPKPSPCSPLPHVFRDSFGSVPSRLGSEIKVAPRRFKVRSFITIGKIKGTYCAREGVQTAAIYFLLDLEDEDTLADLGIEEGDQIDAVPDQRGGKPVILLCPSSPINVNIALELSSLWSFSALYPKPLSNKQPQASASKVCSCIFHPKHRRGPMLGRI